MKLTSTKKLATPESSGKTSSDLSSISTRQLCAASIQPLRKRPFFSTFAFGATRGEARVSVGMESNPQRMQRFTSFGMRLVQFGHFFMATSRQQVTARGGWRARYRSAGCRKSRRVPRISGREV